jgi:arabinogalactan endo-1,4-beta-galactosidase
MKVKLDFHYSDFWCHPGQQPRPRAWTGTSAAQVGPVLKQYTNDVLTAMYEAGALPDIVQVGNENNTGIAGFTGQADMNTMFRGGIEAVREISQQYNHPIKVMLHATNGISAVEWFFDQRAGLDYDILGMSYYPMWHGSRTSLQNGLGTLAKKFNKEICVAEYSSAYTTRSHTYLNNQSTSNADQRSFTDPATERSIQGQANLIRNLNSDIMRYAVNNSGERKGFGSFWWEAAWLPLQNTAWAFTASSEWYQWQANQPGGDSGASNNPGNNPRGTWANQAFFTYEGTVIPSANAFLQLMGKEPRPYTRD